MSQYTPDDLRAIWAFAKQDFERFLETLAWLDNLRPNSRRVQLTAAKKIKREGAAV